MPAGKNTSDNEMYNRSVAQNNSNYGKGSSASGSAMKPMASSVDNSAVASNKTSAAKTGHSMGAAKPPKGDGMDYNANIAKHNTNYGK